jgi:hypothetical protein
MGEFIRRDIRVHCSKSLNKMADSAIAKQLVDKMYEKRKAAALDLEKCVTVGSYCLALPDWHVDSLVNATNKETIGASVKWWNSSLTCSATLQTP